MADDQSIESQASVERMGSVEFQVTHPELAEKPMAKPDRYDEKAAELLPCAHINRGARWCGDDDGSLHHPDCYAVNRNAVAAALRSVAEEAADQAIGKFQDEIRNRLIRDYKLPDSSIDGAGSDGDELEFTMAEIGQAIAQVAEEARTEGWLAAADELAEPYPPDVALFAPLTDEEVRTAVAAMGGDVSGRLHAKWARHWADALRKRVKEQPNGRRTNRP